MQRALVMQLTPQTTAELAPLLPLASVEVGLRHNSPHPLLILSKKPQATQESFFVRWILPTFVATQQIVFVSHALLCPADDAHLFRSLFGSLFFFLSLLLSHLFLQLAGFFGILSGLLLCLQSGLLFLVHDLSQWEIAPIRRATSAKLFRWL